MTSQLQKYGVGVEFQNGKKKPHIFFIKELQIETTSRIYFSSVKLSVNTRQASQQTKELWLR